MNSIIGQHNYTPAFCARFATEDAETKRILINEANHPGNEDEGLYDLYVAFAGLDNVDSPDAIALKKLKNKNIKITNTTTGASVEIKKSKYDAKLYKTDKCPTLLSLGKAISVALAENYQEMLGDADIKDCTDRGVVFEKPYLFDGRNEPVEDHFAEEFSEINVKMDELKYSRDKESVAKYNEYDNQKLEIVRGKIFDMIG